MATKSKPTNNNVTELIQKVPRMNANELMKNFIRSGNVRPDGTRNPDFLKLRVSADLYQQDNEIHSKILDRMNEVAAASGKDVAFVRGSGPSGEYEPMETSDSEAWILGIARVPNPFA